LKPKSGQKKIEKLFLIRNYKLHKSEF